MYQPTYWLHDNIQFPEHEVEQVSRELKRLGAELTVRGYPASSYNFKVFNKPDKIWSKRYNQIVTDITKNIGLNSTSKYNFEYWSQLYTEGTQHNPHHHYEVEGGHPQISFVHFIKPDAPDSFKFITNDKEDWIPLEQNKGDLIVFPSWCWHRVTPIKERLVVAGNIDFVHIDDVDIHIYL